MKKGFLFILFCLLLTCVYSQNYKPLLDNLNEWHFTTCYSGCITDVYYTDGDTLVDGKNYKILDGFHYISRTFLLREEVNNRKIFLNIVSPGISEEYLLYDFSLNEGDIFNMQNPITPFPRDGGPFVVDSIVIRPLADGNEYRHFYFSPAPGNTVSTETAVWIEGVGSLSLINAPGGHPNINNVGHLSCFFKNAEIFYSNLDSINGCVPHHLKMEKNNLDAVTLSKASNGDECFLNNSEYIHTVVVYDLSGKTLDRLYNSGESSLRINLAHYKKGMYFIVAMGNNGASKSFKIIR